jgi:hypothetical protein
VARTINLRRDRILFHSGLVLLMLGGPGLLAGTFAHDYLRVPVVGTSYETFGWVNQIALALGVLLLLVGIVCTALGLRGGVLSAPELAELKAGGSGT